MKASRFVLVLALLAGGCRSFDRRLEVYTVSKIQPGVTRRAEVEGRLGAPREICADAGGRNVFRYYFAEFQRSMDVSLHHRRFQPGHILFRTLTLSYGPSNQVARKLHDESFTPVHRTNAWFHAGPALTPDGTAFLWRKVTTEAEAVARLGEPTARTFDTAGRPRLVWLSLKTRETSWADPDLASLNVLFDEHGVVQDFGLEMRLDPASLGFR